ncbi:MAG TPA: carboxypeptidase-like regulatory domain-containing protein, partial [Longimicrobiaceae bacterium]|nr:carboxypeptidase-like regulatory domain-containing protein [Longimicrobiaceae bacterium]
MIHALRRPVFGLLFLLALPAAAQEPFGAVAGRALDEAGAPVPLSLVRLEPAGGGEERSVLSDEAGAFRFDSVAPGEYRLRLERIGYTAEPTPPFRVDAGRTVEQALRAVLRPVQLAGISANPNACYTAARLADAPDLEALWREAQKGAETRRGFQRRYAFRYDLRIRGVGHVRLFRDQQVRQDTTLYSHPDSVRARREGYGRQTSKSIAIRIPDELDLLEEDFLTT